MVGIEFLSSLKANLRQLCRLLNHLRFPDILYRIKFVNDSFMFVYLNQIDFFNSYIFLVSEIILFVHGWQLLYMHKQHSFFLQTLNRLSSVVLKKLDLTQLKIRILFALLRDQLDMLAEFKCKFLFSLILHSRDPIPLLQFPQILPPVD